MSHEHAKYIPAKHSIYNPLLIALFVSVYETKTNLGLMFLVQGYDVLVKGVVSIVSQQGCRAR